MDSLQELLSVAQQCFELLGVALIIVGTLQALWYWIQSICSPLNTKAYYLFRSILGKSIIAALEVFVAADLIATLIHKDLQNIGVIFALVILRIILGYFLHQELNNLQSE